MNEREPSKKAEKKIFEYFNLSSPVFVILL